MQEMMMLGSEDMAMKTPTIACFPLYPPVELFDSMGLTPVIPWGLKENANAIVESSKHVQNYACGISQQLVEFLLTRQDFKPSLLFFYNACDTLRNLPEILASGMAEKMNSIPSVGIHVPMNGLDRPFGCEYLKKEINRLVTTLEMITGKSFSIVEFKKSVEAYRKMRKMALSLEISVAEGAFSFNTYASIMQETYFLPVAVQVKHLEAIQASITHRPPEKAPAPSSLVKPVILSGILPPPPALSVHLESKGFRIVRNDIASLHRSILYTPNAVSSPGEYYVDFYLNHCPCPTLLYTADSRVPYLNRMLDETGARGVIFLGEKFCEYEYFDMPYLEKVFKKKNVKALLLEFSIDDVENIAPLMNRIDSFAELLDTNGEW